MDNFCTHAALLDSAAARRKLVAMKPWLLVVAAVVAGSLGCSDFARFVPDRGGGDSSRDGDAAIAADAGPDASWQDADAGSTDGADAADVVDVVDSGVCPGSQTPCPSGCVDTSSDLANCGACGVTCGSGQPCNGGGCGPTNENCATAIPLTLNVPMAGTTCHAGSALSSVCGPLPQVFYSVHAATGPTGITFSVTGGLRIGYGTQTAGCLESLSECFYSDSLPGVILEPGETVYFVITGPCADFTVLVHSP